MITSINRIQPSNKLNSSSFTDMGDQFGLANLANEFFDDVPATITTCRAKVWNGTSWILLS